MVKNAIFFRVARTIFLGDDGGAVRSSRRAVKPCSLANRACSTKVISSSNHTYVDLAARPCDFQASGRSGSGQGIFGREVLFVLGPGSCWVCAAHVGADYVLALSESHYLRPEGWEAFFSAMEDYFVALVLKRDRAGSKSPGIPIFAHMYDCPQPRPSQAGPGIGPWLSWAFASYQIPEVDWMPLTTYIIGQWAQFPGGINARLIARGIASPNIRTIYRVGTLNPAPVDSTGPIGDLENEIYPSPQGYAKHAIAL